MCLEEAHKTVVKWKTHLKSLRPKATKEDREWVEKMQAALLTVQAAADASKAQAAKWKWEDEPIRSDPWVVIQLVQVLQVAATGVTPVRWNHPPSKPWPLHTLASLRKLQVKGQLNRGLFCGSLHTPEVIKGKMKCIVQEVHQLKKDIPRTHQKVDELEGAQQDATT